MSTSYDSYELLLLRKINISMGITAIYSSSDLSVQDLLSMMSLKDGGVQLEPPQPEPEQSKHFLHINVSRNLPEIERQVCKDFVSNIIFSTQPHQTGKCEDASSKECRWLLREKGDFGHTSCYQNMN